jgi:hypothetical protein
VIEVVRMSEVMRRIKHTSTRLAAFNLLGGFSVVKRLFASLEI